MLPTTISPPTSEADLIQRATALAGKTIGEIAAELNYEVPATLRRKKGWQGQFVEQCLGADSGNLSQPDFYHLGIELKTLPIDFRGRVLESTYVCVFNLLQKEIMLFEDSPVFHKLQHVLWVPIARDKTMSVMDYRVAQPFLWRAPADLMAIIKKDWEFAAEKVSLGQVDQLNARQGEFLQVRPKAAHARVLTETVDATGATTTTLPRGFYLRAQFTQALIDQHLKVG